METNIRKSYRRRVRTSRRGPSRRRSAEAPRPRGQAERADGKRLAFYAVAEPLFARYGYRKTSIEEICRAARASKRTFYELFTDKVDLASRWILHVSQSVAERWHSAMPPRSSSVRKLERFLDEYERLGREHPVFSQLVGEQDIVRSITKLADERSFRMLQSLMEGILAEGVRRGEFRRLDPARGVWIIYSLLDTVYYLMPATGAMAGPLEDAAFAREVRAFVLNAIVRPGGGNRP